MPFLMPADCLFCDDGVVHDAWGTISCWRCNGTGIEFIEDPDGLED